MKENQVKTSNNLTIGVDWLAFTVLDESFSPDMVISFMGFDKALFRKMPNGANGYKSMKKFENISVLYDGNENMGIHVVITGSSMATVLESFKETLTVDTPFGKAYDMWQETTLSVLLREILKVGKVTRIDLAIDDIGCKYYTLDEILKKLSEGKIISKWRSYRCLDEKLISDYEKVGQTIYFGSNQSEIQLRIYDKQLERNKSTERGSDDYIDYEWVRWELQLLKDRANEVCRLLSNNRSLGDVAIGVLSHYFRIIKLDDINKSRCSSESKWERFVDNVSRLKITVVKEPRTLEEEIEIWEHQNGRKVAKFFTANLGDLGYFGDLACRYAHKLTALDKEQLASVGAY